jgi:2,4-dichlorophenol 6-monooxygenase
VTTQGGFALLCGPRGQAWAAAAMKVAAELRISIKAVTIGLGNGVDVIDAEDSWHRLRGVREEGAILVRPDNIVGWRAAGESQDPERDVRRALLTCLGRKAEAAVATTLLFDGPA